MADVVLRPGTQDDVPGLCAIRRAVVPPAYDAIDAAYDGRPILDHWWSPELFTALLEGVPTPPWPDDIWMRKQLAGAR